MPRTNSARPSKGDVILSRLQEHASTWIPNVDLLKGFILASHYFSLPTTARCYLYGPTNREITFKDVPLPKIAKAVEKHIEDSVPANHRTQVYHKVLVGMPGHMETPEWDVSIPPGPNETPLTPFSKPRDPDLIHKTLLDAFARAANLTARKASATATQITWWDGSDGGKGGCMMHTGEVWRISGGRLGRDHTLEDVPINYFRDRLMDYIWENVTNKDERQASRKAICPDLTEAELGEYTRLVAEDRKKMNEEAERPPTRPTREEQARRIFESGRVVRTYDQAMKIVLMNEAAREIDETIDWKTPKPMGIRRDFRRGPGPIDRSVITPHWSPLIYEQDLGAGMEIDRDCDQVRAMIKTFCCGISSWPPEVFRDHLASTMTRDKFTAFLKKRGTNSAQLKSAAYLLSWEFFKRREQLGLGIEDVELRDDLQELKERNKQESSEDEEEEVDPAEKEEEEARLRERRAREEAWVRERKLIEKLQGEELAALEKSQGERMNALRQQKGRTGKPKKQGASASAGRSGSEATPLAEASSRRLNKRPSDGGDREQTKRVTRSSARAEANRVG